MKHLFLSIFAFLVIPSLSAQPFEFGLNGGIVNYSIHNVWQGATAAALTVYDYTQYQTNIIAPTGALKVMYNMGKFQFGLEADYRMLTYKSLTYPEYTKAIYIYPETQYTDREIPARVFFNRTFKLEHFVAYIGIFAEYIFINSQHKYIDPSGETTTVNHGRVEAGLHVGGTYFVTDCIGINLDVVEEYDNFPTGPLDRNLISFPATLGIRYRIRDRDKLTAKNFRDFM